MQRNARNSRGTDLDRVWNLAPEARPVYRNSVLVSPSSIGAVYAQAAPMELG